MFEVKEMGFDEVGSVLGFVTRSRVWCCEAVCFGGLVVADSRGYFMEVTRLDY